MSPTQCKVLRTGCAISKSGAICVGIETLSRLSIFRSMWLCIQERLIDDVITKKAQLSNDIVCRGIFYSFLADIARGVAKGGGGGGRAVAPPIVRETIFSKR